MERRRLERQWKRSGLCVHKEILRAQCNVMHSLVTRASASSTQIKWLAVRKIKSNCTALWIVDPGRQQTKALSVQLHPAPGGNPQCILPGEGGEDTEHIPGCSAFATIDIFYSYVCLLTGRRQVSTTQPEGTHIQHPKDAKEILQLGSHPGERAPRQPGQCAASLTRPFAVLSAIRHLPCGTQDCIGHATSQEAWPGCWSAGALQTSFQPGFSGEGHREGSGCPPHHVYEDKDLANQCNRDTRVCTVLRLHYYECTMTYCALWMVTKRLCWSFWIYLQGLRGARSPAGAAVFCLRDWGICSLLARVIPHRADPGYQDREPCVGASHAAVWGPTRVCARLVHEDPVLLMLLPF